jgi:hypothetical protein
LSAAQQEVKQARSKESNTPQQVVKQARKYSKASKAGSK